MCVLGCDALYERGYITVQYGVVRSTHHPSDPVAITTRLSQLDGAAFHNPFKAQIAGVCLGRQLGATFCTTAGKNLTTGFGGHARTETMTAFAQNTAWLICAFHGTSSFR